MESEGSSDVMSYMKVCERIIGTRRRFLGKVQTFKSKFQGFVNLERKQLTSVNHCKSLSPHVVSICMAQIEVRLEWMTHQGTKGTFSKQKWLNNYDTD